MKCNVAETMDCGKVRWILWNIVYLECTASLPASYHRMERDGCKKGDSLACSTCWLEKL